MKNDTGDIKSPSWPQIAEKNEAPADALEFATGAAGQRNMVFAHRGTLTRFSDLQDPYQTSLGRDTEHAFATAIFRSRAEVVASSPYSAGSDALCLCSAVAPVEFSNRVCPGRALLFRVPSETCPDRRSAH